MSHSHRTGQPAPVRLQCRHGTMNIMLIADQADHTTLPPLGYLMQLALIAPLFFLAPHSREQGEVLCDYRTPAQVQLLSLNCAEAHQPAEVCCLRMAYRCCTARVLKAVLMRQYQMRWTS